MIRAGLVSVTFRRLSPLEIVRLAQTSELEGIEWGGDVHVPDAKTARDVRTMTEDAGLAVAAYGSYWRGEGDFGPFLDAAVALSAPTIRVWAGARGATETSDRTETTRAVREACERAEAAGLTVSLEYHAGTLTDCLDSTLRLAREVDHPALRFYWQPSPERSRAERLAEIRALKPRLSNLHAFQWTRSHGETLRRPLSEGETDWTEMLRTAAGDRFALLEFLPRDDPALLLREATTLRRLLAAATSPSESRP